MPGIGAEQTATLELLKTKRAVAATVVPGALFHTAIPLPQALLARAAAPIFQPSKKRRKQV
jgi:hypothetical protein